METTYPRRFVNLAFARERYGDRVDRLGQCLTLADPLADAVVAALASHAPRDRDRLVTAALDHGVERALSDTGEEALRVPFAGLFAQLDSVPFWVDRGRLLAGGEAFLASGWFGGIVLALESLIAGYCSPAGNKPLALSGRLKESVPRRLAETSRFVHAVALPGGMMRFGEGFKIAVKVRLMHAQVRRMLLASPAWSTAEWGVPINQADMAGTILLFSLMVLDGLRKLGVPPDRSGAEDLMHLWRYVGYVLGVESDLLPSSEAEGQTLWEILSVTQNAPDADSRELAVALVENNLRAAETPEQRERVGRIVAFAYGASRYLLGNAYADHLGYPRTAWQYLMPALRPAILAGSAPFRRTRLGKALAVRAGTKRWATVVAVGLSGRPATFPMPERLAGGA